MTAKVKQAGIVTDIQHFSLHDGPGIRSTVFLKGCNLNCAWCHNPETISSQPEVHFTADRCIACGACMALCPTGAHLLEAGHHDWRYESCLACGRCTSECFSGAMTLIGREMTAEQVFEDVAQDVPFYANSGGGVTLSGGEPLYQLEFTRRILQLCHSAQISTAIESNLEWPWQRIESLIPLLDLIMVDVKCLDEQRHRWYTGADNSRVVQNIRQLAAQPVDVIVRTPLVAGINDNPDEAAQIADLLATLPRLLYYELLPYHPLGSGKVRGSIADRQHFAPPAVEVVQEIAHRIQQRGICVRIAGKLYNESTANELPA